MKNLYDKLKPCPSCRRKLKQSYHDDGFDLFARHEPGVCVYYYIECACGLRTPEFIDFESHVILFWNGLSSKYNAELKEYEGNDIPDELINEAETVLFLPALPSESAIISVCRAGARPPTRL